MIKPEVGPKTWDDAAQLCADKIDAKRNDGVQHPNRDDGEAMLNDMRVSFDDFAAWSYGRELTELDRNVITEYFIALAIVTLDTAPHYDNVGVSLTSAEEILPLLRRKQEDYGYQNIHRFGTDGIIVRAHDKIARIENLTDLQVEGRNESLIDSFTDLIGYCIIGMMEVQGIWMLPLSSSPNLHPQGSLTD
jgi:hypothetical protein